MNSAPEYIAAQHAYAIAYVLVTGVLTVMLFAVVLFFRRAVIGWAAAGDLGDEGKLARRFITVLILGAVLLTLIGYFIVRVLNTPVWLCVFDPQLGCTRH
jgi:hypothetical protein